ncbi:hypothetical protein B0T18DRAFT_448926 [Schizothecium vesticola]|uniref:RCC1/BLIP-II n=1 Tax=Schizothecium vesticola TaxID=314040 RepID=A0AA40EJ21_9PEZI|nr:hypothetical protein B0T18DRAFT_448926 [Schizothecium vesticola]
MELYGTGLNAWNQLRFGCNEADAEPDDLHTFTCVLADDDIRHVRPYLSWTTGHLALLPPHNNPPPHPPLPPSTWPTPTPPTHLTSHATGFALLHPPSTVLTTSDLRFSSCLGRPPSSLSPSTPHPVPDLLDLPTGPVVKIASSSSGYVLAALTAGGDLYAWGHAGRASAAGLGGLGVTGEVTPVVVEEHDIADVGVGEGHVVVLTTTGEVFGIGSNRNGQLGLGEGMEGAEEWTRVGGGRW